ncbi:MAG: tetratricopeptide repeat protein [Acidobacteria bacterium]|nr:tetratricopeptide repeat protein [Acidobacteriota bacterium]
MQFLNLHPARAHLFVLLLSLNIYAQTPPPTDLSEIDDLATTLVTLKSAEERQQVLARNKTLLTPNLRRALIDRGNSQLLAGRYSTAFDIYGIAQNVAEQIGDKEGVATAWLDIGTVYYFQANYPAALEHYQKARDLFTEVSNKYEAAKALSGLALIYKEQRREAEALATFQQVVSEFKSLGDTEESANALNMIGAIHYGQGNYAAAAAAFLKSTETNGNVDSVVRLADAFYMQGDYAQALTSYKKSLDSGARREIGVVVAALNGAANSAYYLGNYDEALEKYQRSVDVQKTLTDKVGLANALKGLGNVHRARGDYGAALENYFQSLSIFEEIKAPLGTTFTSIGLVRALRGDYAQALDYYNRALKEFKSASNKIDMARVLTLIGNVYYKQGQYDFALSSYRQSLTLREAMDDESGQGDVLAGIGSTLLRQKNYSEALDNFEKALGLFRSIRNQEKMADILTRVSETFLLQNDSEKALSAAESAATIATGIDQGELLWYARMLAGNAHAKVERGPEAYQALTGSIATIESLRAEAFTVAAGDHNRSLPYLSMIDLLMSQHRPSEAFHYAERAKTQFITDLLKNNNATTHRGLSVEQRREEQRLSGEVASFEIQLHREKEQRVPNEKRASDLRDRLRRARTAYAGFRQKVFSENPGLKIRRGELAPLKLDEIHSLIGDTSTALVEYTITENNTYMFVLTADKGAAKTSQRRRPTEINLKVYPLDVKHHELASRVRHFEQLLSSRADNFHELARELYELLLQPAEDQIALKTRLVIVPDGLLWRLPFEALQPAEDRYLVDQAQVSYAPSLSALREMQKLRLPAKRLNSLLVAYANPELSKNFATRFELVHAGMKLESFAGQEEQIQRIAASYGTTTSVLHAGAQASEERIKGDMSRASILHFAGPTILDDASPMSSFIGLSTATSQPSAATRQPLSATRQDGFLQSRELMDLQSTAELVVAPTTRHTASFTGDAAVGFSWSWFVAGTRATLVSRWQVESPVLSTLMTGFYSSIKPATRTPVSKSRALHQNVLALRRSPNHQHPYYWATFALIGDAR